MQHPTLAHLFADLYPTEADIRRVLDEAAVPTGEYDLEGAPITLWSNVLIKLRNTPDKVAKLVVNAENVFNIGEELLHLYTRWHQQQQTQRRVVSGDEYPMASATMSGNGAFRAMQEDIRGIRKDLDDLNVRTTIELRTLGAQMDILTERMDKVADQISTEAAHRQNEVRNGRVLLYAIIFSLAILFVLFILANLGTFLTSLGS
jgi:hypothetical protein